MNASCHAPSSILQSYAHACGKFDFVFLFMFLMVSFLRVFPKIEARSRNRAMPSKLQSSVENAVRHIISKTEFVGNFF